MVKAADCKSVGNSVTGSNPVLLSFILIFCALHLAG